MCASTPFSDPHMHSPGIIILAAGLGTRFQQAGGQGNKLLAPYPDAFGVAQPLLKFTIDQAKRSGLPLILVTRPGYHAIHQLAQQAGIRIICLESAGSGESIAAAVRETPHWRGWLIQPGDMAWVTAEDHLRVTRALQQGASQVRLTWQQQPGHPVGFAASWYAALSQLQDDTGARTLLNTAQLTLLEGHAGVTRDADLPASAPRHF